MTDTLGRPAMKPHSAYRADIEGLRTLAVLPVVLNHAGVQHFNGGFIGVDIFFVVSGYLITGILVRDMAAGQYSIAEFYRRRILRIFPALIVVLAATTIVAAVTMLPSELIRYARSLGATTLFGSNLLFWSETGYFAPAAKLKPLLHTWSLAIEEQFYILWPLLLGWIAPRRVVALKVMVLTITVLSFAFATWLVSQDPTSAFYLLPSRAWELSIGAAVAVFPSRTRSRLLDEIMGAAGLLLIAFAISRYTDATPFPGAAALLPCAGAALLIATGSGETWAARVLSIAPMTFVGRISYSLYLWHWPVIVFAEVALFLPHTLAMIAAEVGVSLALAWLSWRFIEQPFRRSSDWNTSRVLHGAALAMGLTIVVAAVIWASGGLAQRFTPAQQQLAAFQDLDGDALYRSGSCFAVGDQIYDQHCLWAPKGRPILLLVGDSHGAHLWPGLSRHTEQFSVLQATRTGCKPVLYPHARAGSCEAFFRDVLGKWLPTHSVDRLLLAARWRSNDVALVEATLRDPHVQAAHPILIGPVPQYTTALPRLLVFADRQHRPDLPARSLDDQVFDTDKLLRVAAARTGTPYLSMVDALCQSGKCREWAAAGVPMQFDYGHFTVEGSRFAVDKTIWPSVVSGR